MQLKNIFSVAACLAAFSLTVLPGTAACPCNNTSYVIVSNVDSLTTFSYLNNGVPYGSLMLQPATFPQAGTSQFIRWNYIQNNLVPGAQWIWPYNTPTYFYQSGPFEIQRSFNFSWYCCLENVTARINISADDTFNLTFNNQPIGFASSVPSCPTCSQWSDPVVYSYTLPIQNGPNVMRVRVQNYGLPDHYSPYRAGLIYRLTINWTDCCYNISNYTYSSPLSKSSCGIQREIITDSAPEVLAPSSTPAPSFPACLLSGSCEFFDGGRKEP